MGPEIQAAPASKTMLWAGRIISAVPILVLLMSAVAKFVKPPGFEEGFKHLGWEEHMALVLGVVEIACTILYAIPRTAVLGAILLTGYFGGAIATHARIGEPAFVLPLILGMLVWCGLYLRDTRVRALVPLRS